MTRNMRRAGYVWLFAAAASVLLIAGSNLAVVLTTRMRVFTDPEQLPHAAAALVPGTSSRVAGGGPNPFFTYRMDKAAQLYRNGKVERFILSGDNRTPFYDEPAMMRNALLERGIPMDLIVLDTAGLRTLDSIIRSREVFGQESLIIVTQPFHAYRALFLCDYFGIPAVAFAAREPGERAGWQVYLREVLARAKAVLDVYILGTRPESLPDHAG